MLQTIDVTDVPKDVLKNAKYAEVVGPNVDLKVLADISGCYEVMVALGRENKKMNDYTLKEFNQRFR
jgi:alanine racemase